MAVLTWRDVAAPDFRGVQEGYRNFSNMLDGAFDAAKGGIKDYRAAQTDATSSALLAQIAGAQTADEAKAIAAGVGSNFNPRQISDTAWKALAARPGDIIKQAGDESDLNFTNYTRDKIHKKDAAMELANPILHQAGLLASTGKLDDAYKLIQDNPDAVGGLGADEFFSQIKGLQTTASGDTSTRSARFIYDKGVRDDTENRLTQVASEELRSQGIDVPSWQDSFPAFQQGLIEKYGPEQGVIIAKRARDIVFGDPTATATYSDSNTYGAGGVATTGGSGGSAGGDPTRIITGGGDGNLGIGSVPENVQTLGQAVAFGKSLNNRGQESSAMGLFQITQSTMEEFGPKALGANWASQPFNADTQNKIAAAIYRDAVGRKDPVAALRGRWTSLKKIPDNQVRQIASAGWEQARNLIAQGESGASNVDAILSRVVQDTTGTAAPQYERSQDPQQAFAREAVMAFKDDSNYRQVAAKLAGEGGVLAGENVGSVTDKIKEIAQTYDISAPLAGVVLSRSLGGNQGIWDGVKDATYFFGDGLNAGIDKTLLDKYGKLAKDRDGLLRQYNTSQVLDASSALVASSSQADAAATAQAQARAAAFARLHRRGDVSGALAAAVDARGAHGAALANAGAVATAGDRQADQPPKVDNRNVPQSNPGPVPAPAVRAQSYLERVFDNMVPEKAGPVQVQGIADEFKRKFGVSIEQVRSNPQLAWEAAKRADNKAAQLIKEKTSKRSAYFSR